MLKDASLSCSFEEEEQVSVSCVMNRDSIDGQTSRLRIAKRSVSSACSTLESHQSEAGNQTCDNVDQSETDAQSSDADSLYRLVSYSFYLYN